MLGAMAVLGTVAGASLLGGCAAPRSDSSSTASQVASSAATETSASSSSQSGTSSSASATAPSKSSTSAAATSSSAIVAVFSWSGNTLTVADRVAEDAHAELFRIEPATPYTTDYNEMLQVAQDEQAAGTLPQIAGNVPDWSAYTTVYLGFPTWWGHLPQIVKSFLAEHDCSGKVIYPFNTHGGSGFASCLSDLSAACPGADIRNGLSLLGDSVSSNMAQVDSWVAASA